MTRHECDELTGDDLLCDELNGSHCANASTALEDRNSRSQ